MSRFAVCVLQKMINSLWSQSLKAQTSWLESLRLTNILCQCPKALLQTKTTKFKAITGHQICSHLKVSLYLLTLRASLTHELSALLTNSQFSIPLFQNLAYAFCNYEYSVTISWYQRPQNSSCGGCWQKAKLTALSYANVPFLKLWGKRLKI